MRKQKILIFIDWYFPAYKAGGPIQSIKNFVEHFCELYDIYIVTSNTDFSSAEKLNVLKNTWTLGYKSEQVFYFSEENYSIGKIKSLINEVNPNFVYINSMYSIKYAIIPLFLLKILNSHIKIILAPRGMLQDGALKFKSFKKKALINLIFLLGISKKINFQATDEQEEKDIKKYFKNYRSVSLVKNFTSKTLPENVEIKKEKNELKIIFLSRIVEKKNLYYLLENLPINNDYKVSLEIWGDIGDEVYWKKCEAKIKELIELGISISYCGAIENEWVTQKMQQNHVYVLPTYGENFGHTIYESFSASRPVVVSNKTPWLNLEETKAGFDISLDNTNDFKQALVFFVAMNQEDYNNWSKGAYNIAVDYLNQTSNNDGYLNLFKI